MKYSKKIVDRICMMVSTGDHTIAEICKKININQDTYFDWKKTKPEFSEALKKAEEDYLDSIKIKARSGLAALLEVKEYEEVKTEFGLTKEGKPVKKSETRTKKFIMPNVTAVIYGMNNTDPTNFRQRHVIAHTGPDDEPLPQTVIRIGYGNQTDESQEPES